MNDAQQCDLCFQCAGPFYRVRIVAATPLDFCGGTVTPPYARTAGEHKTACHTCRYTFSNLTPCGDEQPPVSPVCEPSAIPHVDSLTEPPYSEDDAAPTEREDQFVQAIPLPDAPSGPVSVAPVAPPDTVPVDTLSRKSLYAEPSRPSLYPAAVATYVGPPSVRYRSIGRGTFGGYCRLHEPVLRRVSRAGPPEHRPQQLYDALHLSVLVNNAPHSTMGTTQSRQRYMSSACRSPVPVSRPARPPPVIGLA